MSGGGLQRQTEPYITSAPHPVTTDRRARSIQLSTVAGCHS